MQEIDKASERWWIEGLARRQREKWPLDISLNLPGFQRRSNLDWYGIGLKLADIQSEYDGCEEFYPRHLVQRALMAIWPVMMPYPWPPTHHLSRREIEKAREQVTPALLAFSMMAGKQTFASAGFDFPRITIRRRRKHERMASSIQKDTASARQNSEEIIGRSVLQEYRQHPPTRRSLDSAFMVVAELGSIDGVATNSVRSVESRYHAFRRLAFDRGYADSRAFWCEWEGAAWPEDQVWLEDFPTVD